VVDASVALKWFLPEAGNSGAENLLTAFLIGTVALYAPDLLLIEAGSGLWRRSIVLKQLAPSDAKAIYRDLLTLPLNFQPSERLAASALSLSIVQRHSPYDCLYCALALEMDCEFVTADRKLVTKLERSLPFIRHVSTINL
jgi:predicted nucleic acid-binding protein